MKISLLLFCCLLLSAGADSHCSAEKTPGPGDHHYRNLFAENGHSQKEVERKIQAAYQQLFHGDPQTQAVYFEAGKNANGKLAYITDWANHDVRTEGMSYGMMIAVQLDDKEVFDTLWNWAMTYMYISEPKHPSHGYFSWSCKTNGTPNEETPAPDGEEYFAMALLFAANRWPGGTGIYDYHAHAEALLHDMVHREVLSGMTRFGMRTVGPEMDKQHTMVLFVPGIMPHPFTDPSYHLPAFYQLFALWGPPEDRDFWRQAADVSRHFFEKTTNPITGLAPSYANFDGTPHMTRFPQSEEFGYDAWRVASNWSVDWSWWHKAPAEQELSDRIQRFFLSQGIANYGPVYTVDGKPLGATPGLTFESHPIGLMGTNAVASLAAKNRTNAKQFVEALWNAPIPSGQNRYYDGMLYLMNLMHCAGKFKIIMPVQPANTHTH
ncbi:glycosyl hydrolase family 8 [Alloacidobacterium sp.]|uniref:glycosyl hydrolase family 8 n=1 Tax=Alloacidobacterium sp. TaxID=2951999 RepID=UPI002D577A90|nr:glycosyl hydrolase family 8 [Alloacidobacterium sp.]HYK34466.1 glycosyl hydrolase family 8 [Alloacidobacterium sp.]